VTASRLARVFMLRLETWEDGTAVAPVDQKAKSPVRSAFTQAIHRRSVSAISSYWQRVIYSDRGSPPPEVGSDEAVLAALERHPGSVGYVSAATPLDDRFRVLEVTGVPGYDVAELTAAGGGPTDVEIVEFGDLTVARHGDLRLFLTGSCGPGDEGRQVVLENGNAYEDLSATIETSVWDDGWLRASSVARHALAPLAEERLGCTHKGGGIERRYAIVEASSASTYRAVANDLGQDSPAREAIKIVGSGTCGRGRQGVSRSLINRHPWNTITVQVETREVFDGIVKRRYVKDYKLPPGNTQRLGCSADGKLEQKFTVLGAKYR